MDDEPTYDIAIARVSGPVPIEGERLVEAVEATLRRHATATASISVALVDDIEITRLNEFHLDHRGPTDVLTFDLRDDVSLGAGPHPAVEGDIALSVDAAARAAGRRGHGLEAELALYAVHGTLHLLGYTDADEAGAARMHAVEDDVLCALGFGCVYGAEPS